MGKVGWDDPHHLGDGGGGETQSSGDGDIEGGRFWLHQPSRTSDKIWRCKDTENQELVGKRARRGLTKVRSGRVFVTTSE